MLDANYLVLVSGKSSDCLRTKCLRGACKPAVSIAFVCKNVQQGLRMSTYFVYLVYLGQVEQMAFVPLVPLLWERFPENCISPKWHRFPLATE